MLTKKAPHLFCKPTKTNDEIVFSEFVDGINGTISFKSLNLKTELPVIHNWVNMDYTQQYWQMNGQFSQFYAMYQCMEFNPYSHSFTGFFNAKLVCQFDVYSVFADELKAHIGHEDHDCGFHLLMSPNKVPVHGLTTAIVKSFLNYYFSFPEAKRMYAEPDVNNKKSIELLEKCGFVKIKTVEMSYKRADVYLKHRPQTPSAP
ncbi:MAG: acetyltransferase [Ferruginibacter sp.]|nr:acetyltransferase [Bacteroidota bacterium]MBX2920178.1 acetyltransferase [Ferruginibacter sp.]